METRQGKIIVSSTGGTASKGSKTYKVSLPSSWVKALGIGDSRRVDLRFDGKTICIEKQLSPSEFAVDRTGMGHNLTKLTFYDGNTVCSEIYADFTEKTLKAENKNVDAVKLPFGNNSNPGWEDFEAFLAERCIPKERSGVREYLEAIGVDKYEPLEIIKKTRGRMAEDNQWICVEELT